MLVTGDFFGSLIIHSMREKRMQGLTSVQGADDGEGGYEGKFVEAELGDGLEMAESSNSIMKPSQSALLSAGVQASDGNMQSTTG